jgi:hypothetical protein
VWECVQWEGLAHYTISRAVEAVTRYGLAFEDGKEWAVQYRMAMLHLIMEVQRLMSFRHEQQVLRARAALSAVAPSTAGDSSLEAAVARVLLSTHVDCLVTEVSSAFSAAVSGPLLSHSDAVSAIGSFQLPADLIPGSQQ